MSATQVAAKTGAVSVQDVVKVYQRDSQQITVLDGLNLLESFVDPPGDPPGLLLHPRCVHMASAFENYTRRKAGTRWVNYLADDHPYEDMMDSLRGGVRTAFPDGRRPPPRLNVVPGYRVF